MEDDLKTVYDFSFRKATGEVLPLSGFRGKVLLIVNTASRCGFTVQYKGLEQLYRQYQPAGLEILGVPSDDFGGQEPGSDDEIQAFCQTSFGLSFPIVKKESVRGPKAHPLYRWARERMGFWASPHWNFHKYLVDRQGHLVDYFYPTTSPSSQSVLRALSCYLDTNRLP